MNSDSKKKHISQIVLCCIGLGATVVLLWVGCSLRFEFNLLQNIGNGSYPGTLEDFYEAFLDFNEPSLQLAKVHWCALCGCACPASFSCSNLQIENSICAWGTFVIAGGGIMLLFVFIVPFLKARRAIFPALLIVAGFAIAFVGLENFNYHYWGLDADLFQYYAVTLGWGEVYTAQLQLHEILIFPAGVISGCIACISALSSVTINKFSEGRVERCHAGVNSREIASPEPGVLP